MTESPTGRASPEPEPALPAPTPPVGPEAERREHMARAWVSAVMVVLLLVAAGFALAWSYLFFGVVLVVMGVFAAVETSWTLRRARRRR